MSYTYVYLSLCVYDDQGDILLPFLSLALLPVIVSLVSQPHYLFREVPSPKEAIKAFKTVKFVIEVVRSKESCVPVKSEMVWADP